MMSTPNGSSPAFQLDDSSVLNGRRPERPLEQAVATKTARDPEAPTAAPSEFMTVREVANIVKLHEKVIRRAYESGELRAYKPRGRIRIRRSDVEAWLEANAVEPYPVPEIEP
jgi:excisionase family DNA binding protein